jgi:hypothetical protein
MSLVFAVSAVGTPHLLWDYRYVGETDHKQMLSCGYAGQFPQRVAALDGACPLIMFFRRSGDEP